MESLNICHLSPFSLCHIFIAVIYWQSTLAGDCPADGRTWVPFRQRCYHFVHGEEDITKSYTFEAAKHFCNGYELLSIQSVEENAFIVDYSPEVWKGNVNMWLGMYYDSDNDGLKWLDESNVSFTNWESGSGPSDEVPMDTCAALHSNTGKWEVVSCVVDIENGVVCEAAEKAEEEGKPAPSPLLSALVILSVVGIIGISAAIWFMHQKHIDGSTTLTSFEYHPPFRAPSTDEACLVEAEESDDTP